tara:strand:- start:118993 stop:119163 length:171 start_codon:yes stop_codon:yes gene_type:complete
MSRDAFPGVDVLHEIKKSDRARKQPVILNRYGIYDLLFDVINKDLPIPCDTIAIYK